jgi:cobalt-zinc-cadmium efflux system outer membrane protein
MVRLRRLICAFALEGPNHTFSLAHRSVDSRGSGYCGRGESSDLTDCNGARSVSSDGRNPKAGPASQAVVVQGPIRWLAKISGGLALASVVFHGLLGSEARAQAPTIDTSVPALPGSGASLFGFAPGSGGGSFLNLPGTGGILGGRPGVSTPKGIPTTIGTPGVGPGPADMQMAVSSPQPAPVSPTSSPYYGTLEIATQDDDGPPNGLTLEQAIDITLERSLDLRSKFLEIPMARADILQANLRSNPIFYQDGQLLQYKGTSTQFTRAAPGGPSQFDTNVTYPLDISHKRQARTAVATRAERVLEALYQDAVRQRIDDVYGAFVNVLAARQTYRYAKQSADRLVDITERNEKRFAKGDISQIELNQVRIRYRTAKAGLVDAEAAYRKSKRDLGSLMNLTLEEIGRLEVKGTIADVAPAPPPIDDLRKLAVAERPDIVSLRLGVQRALADVRLAKANAYSDVYVLWQPYTFQDNAPYGLKSQYSWALGVTVPLPIYNRNQGGISRAKINVTQSELQLGDLERQTEIDIEAAVQEYEVSKRLVDELREHIVPPGREDLERVSRRYQAGDSSILEYLDAQQDFNQIVKQYLDTAVRHRRSMLSLNTVVGKKIMP